MRCKNVSTVEDFNAWLKTAKQNDRIIYHVGRFAETWGNGGARGCLASVVYEASERGDVVLFQQRIGGDGYFEYTATRSLSPVSVRFWGCASTIMRRIVGRPLKRETA
jgi:hypothetical protein